MRFTQFKFENFKGIKSQTLVLNKNSNSNVFALVGLNESGKTTVLEAINYFVHKPESLNALELDNYSVDDIYNIIPINKRDNFNGEVVIGATVELDADDIVEIKKAFLAKDIVLSKWDSIVTYTQKYFFENSVYIKDKYRNEWISSFEGVIGKTGPVVKLPNELAVIADSVIMKRIPSILYFPNFLFEFPERIYLDSEIEDKKHKYYQVLIQDVLDSLDTGTNINDHLVSRINSDDQKDKRNLISVIGKMQRKLTEVIFEKWNQIFSKEISKTEIVILPGKDDKGPYLEFNIKDDVDTYRIVERSLGFRWFFVYILLTQFRTYRKKYSNVLFLFDEPASNLHPSAQMELLKSFEKLPKVIYTTHSHYLVNPKWLENTFVIKNEAIDYNDETKYDSRNTNIKISTYRDFSVKYPNQTTYFQPILEVLDYRPSNLEMVPKVVITEGKNDFYTFCYMQDIIKVYNNSIKILPGTSSSNMESLISLYLGWGKDFCVLLDSDKEGLKQKKRYLDSFGSSISSMIITYEDINPIWKNLQTEDLFTEADRMLIQNRYYASEHNYSKKVFNRSIQELYMNNESVPLSKDAIKNFQKVISYLKVKLKI